MIVFYYLYGVLSIKIMEAIIKKSKKVTKKEQREYLREMLSSNERWAIKALLLIYDYQTEEEKQVETTSDLNGVGFTGTDGEILTSFANQYLRKGTLSPRQKEIMMPKMKKYWQQVLHQCDIEKLNNNILKRRS